MRKNHFYLDEFNESDATVVVGDVSDESSILNAAFLNKKVLVRYHLFIQTIDLYHLSLS